MLFIHLIILLALLQLFVFAQLTGMARLKYKVAAPAVTGNENFERYYRVQMNTIELIILFVPSIYIASIYWSPYLMASLGVIYLMGRVLYFFAYTRGKNRAAGYLMSLIPTLVFIVAGIAGVIRALTWVSSLYV